MDIVQVTRRIVDQQVRPGQRGATTLGEAKRRGAACFLVTTGADGSVHSFGTYGRGKYGEQRYR
jgi:hypothetical protein